MAQKYSIVIPVHNRREFLAQAITSCLWQTIQNLEIVISDDCSTEDLAEVVKGFHDARIRYVRSKERLGAVGNHRHAVSLATGSYVLILHSDDIIFPECLQLAGQVLDGNEAAAAVYYSQTYWKGDQISGCHPVPKLGFADARISRENPWLEKFHGINPSCCLFRKEAYERAGGFRTELKLFYDYDLYMRFMNVAGGVAFLGEILCIYRQHEEQSVNMQQSDGLSDVLTMWSYPEYAHWSAAGITDQLISAIRNLQLRGWSLRPALDEVIKKKMFWKLALGLPRAVGNRIMRRFASPIMGLDSNYTTPRNVEKAIATATRLATSCSRATSLPKKQ